MIDAGNTTVDCKITSATTGDKHFDKSPTKTRHPRKVDLRARYWAFLFDNLRRAVDEIYVTCESDQSVVECKEVLMMLDNYVRDFKALIDWIQLQEKLEKTDAQSRGSPGTVAAPRLAPTGVSWADKFTVSTVDDVKNSGSTFSQDNSVQTSEIPAVHIDTECVLVTQQTDTPPLQATEDKFSAEKARIESEMDPSDISNVSAANLSMAEVLAKKEELADRLEKANEEAIASAIAEEEQLTREIEAEENNDINIETDNDSDFSEKDVRKWKEELLDQRRRMMEEKLLHAEFKREVQLQAIVKKAQEEEAKVNEIAFINTLEAQNKRHDVLSKLKEYEQRLNELQEERQRRQEEKQARDEAVQERKRALEAERQARVEELLMKRKEQEARIEQQRQEKEKAREDAARERARDREERLAALTAAQQEAMEELQKKIQLKHDESIRRHMEQIEQRKEKAAELSSGRHANTDYAPKLTPYERKKQCSLCSVLISSEVYLFSHIKGRKHQQAVRENSSIQGRELSDEEVEHLSLKKYIVDIVVESAAPPEPLKDGEERQKNKKKAKKIKARMNFRAKEYESLMETKNSGSDSPYKAK
ncbi:hypothetical protein CB1_000113017 [Camelus ferus]|nr:hypothetical protein CB1_000113017 [Camelus ferus]